MWHELKIFLQAQNTAPQIWWRDDDATQDCEALNDYLQSMPNAPILLAVIADKYDASLVAKIKNLKHIKIAQHGFAHVNHALDNEKKSEYPKTRTLHDIEHELKIGSARLQKDFGEQFLSVFVPPWNRMHEDVETLLVKTGFKGFSMFKGNPQNAPIKRYDSHIDIINWRQDKSFIGTENFIINLRHEIQNNRQKIGILTHHKVHDNNAKSFLLDFHKFVADNSKLIEIVPPPF